MAKFLCLTGFRRVGKDHMTQALIAALGDKGITGIRLSFSDELRGVCNRLFDWLPAVIPEGIKDIPFDHPKNFRNLTPRDIWKLVADDETGICSVQPDVLVDLFKRNQFTSTEEDVVYIITDLRKQAEYKMVKENGIKLIRLNPCNTPTQIDDVEKMIPLFEVDDEMTNHNDMKSVCEFLEISLGLLDL